MTDGMFVCLRGGCCSMDTKTLLVYVDGVVWVLYGLCMFLQVAGPFFYLLFILEKREKKDFFLKKNIFTGGQSVATK